MRQSTSRGSVHSNSARKLRKLDTMLRSERCQIRPIERFGADPTCHMQWRLTNSRPRASLRPCYAEVRVGAMFEDREQSIFPHPISAWWIPVLLVFGWAPPFVADFIETGRGAGGFFEMAWGMGITPPCTLLAALSVLIQAFRLLMYFLNRPKPLSK